jgi:dienelactone hydrolase
MQVQQFKVEKTTRYYSLGDLESADKLLFVLHGYGQLPQFFIRKFQTLVEKGYFIVAPEGLHRFYLEGTSGRVGASWMTKEERLDDIEDNILYLKLLTEYFIKIKHFKNVSLLGFSQGGATATRFYEKFPQFFDTCVLWASVFPDDVSFSQTENELNYQFVIGTEDQYFTNETTVKLLAEYQKNSIKTHQFIGDHNIDVEMLNQLF